MILGTHNSATGGQLLWWLRPLAWVINLTSKCQDKTITDQLADGVKIFNNLQVALVGGKMYGKTWLDRLPLPRRQARKHNERYKKECVTDYLMLDFYNY